MNIKVLSKELSEELGLPAEVIEKIGKSQFKLLSETIREGKMESVYLKFIGRWGIKPEREKHFDKSEKFLASRNTDV